MYKEKSLKELLELVKENFNADTRIGLCDSIYALNFINTITEIERDKINKYLKEYGSTLKSYYIFKSLTTVVKTDLFSDNVYYWHPYFKKSRIEWLDENIKLNS